MSWERKCPAHLKFGEGKLLLVRSHESKGTLRMRFNSGFWYQASDVRFQSHLKIRRRPKYEVIGDILGEATLTMLFHDFEKRPEHIDFDSIEVALRYAERYETESSAS